MVSDKTVAIIGCGQVGSTIAYTLYIFNMCNIILVNHNKVKAESNVCDISDCEVFSNHCTIKAGDYKDIADADIVINCAGDSSLLRSGDRNSEFESSYRIARDIINNLNRVNFHGIFINVMNPCDDITYLFKDLNVPTCKIMGTGTMLETVRLRRIVLDWYGAETDSYIIGHHGTNNDIVCKDIMIELSDAEIEHILNKVRNRVWDIYKGKGFTNFGISSMLFELISSILCNNRTVLCVSTIVDGMCISVPCEIDSSGIHRVLITPIEEMIIDRLFRKEDCR